MTESLVQFSRKNESWEENHYTFMGNYDGNKRKWIGHASYITFNKKNFYWIEIAGLLVKEEFRNKGYGEALMRIILKDIKESHQESSYNIFIIVTTNSYAAIILCNKLGFRNAFKIERDGEEYLVMVYNINSVWIYQLKCMNLLSLHS